MPRPPSADWHSGNPCWASDVGDRLPSGRRRPVYFRDIAPGPKGSAGWRKAQAALAEYLRGRDAREETVDRASLATVSRLYLAWFKSRVEAGRAKPVTLTGHRRALKKFNEADAPGGGRMAERPAATLTATDMAAVVGRWAEAGHKPTYLARIVACVQSVLNWSVEPLAGRDRERLIPANPIRGFSHEVTRAPHSPDRYAAEAEVRAAVRVGGGGGGEWWGRITLDPRRWKSGGKTGRPREVFQPAEAVRVIEGIRALPGPHPCFIWTHKRGSRAADRGFHEPSHGEVWDRLVAAHQDLHAEATGDRGRRAAPGRGPRPVRDVPGSATPGPPSC